LVLVINAQGDQGGFGSLRGVMMWHPDAMLNAMKDMKNLSRCQENIEQGRNKKNLQP